MNRFCFPLFFQLFLATTLSATPMMRVVEVRDARTVILDRNGVATTITLASVGIPSAEEAAATAYLRQTLIGNWVLVEQERDGSSSVYRSPDGLYVNGELARRAYATRNLHMTYLGEAMPAPSPLSKTSAGTVEKTPKRATPKLTPARTRPRGSHRIPRL